MPLVRLIDGRKVETDRLPVGVKVRYGRMFRPGVTLLQIELAAFRDDWQPPFGKGRFGHCKTLITTIWPNYQWNEWSEKKFRPLCMFDLVGFMGCAGSGKSKDLGMYALLCWWSAPQDTAVAVTSESIEGAKQRVWGHIVTAHQEAQWLDDNGVRQETPGTVTDQPPKVALKQARDSVRGAGQQSILLVAAGNASTDSALKTLQGLHQEFVLIILDELQDLTAGIIGDSVLGNLKRNPRLQLLAAGNISDPDDPLGTFCRPVTPAGKGYDDVNEETETWAIERLGIRGVCVRFDAERTPNLARVAEGLPEFTFLPQVWEVKAEREALERGERDVSAYYRQLKAFIAPRNAEDGPYSPAAILKFQAAIAADWASAGVYLSVAGCDPAYTSGGDRFILYLMHYGLTGAGLWTVEFKKYRALQHDIADNELRNYAMVRQAKRICLDEWGVSADNFAADCSGKNPIGDIIAAEWSPDFLRVNFQGKPSEMPVSLVDRRLCSQEYGNKSAELWGALSIFVRHGQVRGLDKQHQRELGARKTWRGTQNRLLVEQKVDMRKRTGYSPDVADGGNVGLELLRVRHGAVAGAENLQAVQQSWQRVEQEMEVVPIRLQSNRGIQSFPGYFGARW